MSFFITGILVGIVSLIPGISGGTIIYLRNQYEEITSAITNIKCNKKKIVILLLGVIIGSLMIARIIEYLFKYIPSETIMLFWGFLLFSTPEVINKEKKNLNFKGLIIGILIIILLFIFLPSSEKVITEYPKLSIWFLIMFSISGIIDGFITILPGISGSMVLMLLGPYYLYKSYIANISLNNIIFLIPLSIYFISDLLGIYLGSKISNLLLNRYHNMSISIIIGFLISSLIIMIPFKEINSTTKLLSISIAIIISYITINILNLIKKNNT